MAELKNLIVQSIDIDILTYTEIIHVCIVEEITAVNATTSTRSYDNQAALDRFYNNKINR